MKKTALKISIIVFCLASTPLVWAETDHAFLWDPESGMQDLGTLGGTSSIATAVSNDGVVVGYSDTTEGTSHAFFWTAEGGMQDLGVPDARYLVSNARAINNKNEISGVLANSRGALTAFYWTASTGFTVLPLDVDVNGMNDSAEITGTGVAQGIVQAFIWDPLTGKTKTLGFLPGSSDYSYGLDVNNLGNVAGESFTSSGTFHPTFWSRTTGMLDLGVPPDVDFGAANALNDHNEVVGETWLSTTGGSGVGFYWSQSTGRVALVTLQNRVFTIASGINNRGKIVGQCEGDSLAAPTRAVLWESYASKPRDLGTLPGGSVSGALGLNDRGQVVGWGNVSQ